MKKYIATIILCLVALQCAFAQQNLNQLTVFNIVPGYKADGRPWPYVWTNNTGSDLKIVGSQIYASAYTSSKDATQVDDVTRIGHLTIVQPNPYSITPTVGPELNYMTAGPGVNVTPPVQWLSPNYMTLKAGQQLQLACSALSQDHNYSEMAQFVVFIWYTTAQ